MIYEEFRGFAHCSFLSVRVWLKPSLCVQSLSLSSLLYLLHILVCYIIFLALKIARQQETWLQVTVHCSLVELQFWLDQSPTDHFCWWTPPFLLLKSCFNWPFLCLDSWLVMGIPQEELASLAANMEKQMEQQGSFDFSHSEVIIIAISPLIIQHSGGNGWTRPIGRWSMRIYFLSMADDY